MLKYVDRRMSYLSCSLHIKFQLNLPRSLRVADLKMLTNKSRGHWYTNSPTRSLNGDELINDQHN